MGRRAARTRAVRHRAAAVLDARARRRARRPARCRAYGIGVIPWSPLAGGWLSGRYRKGARAAERAADRQPARYDLTLPENQRKLDAAERSAARREAGLTLIELAIAFVLGHPAVTRRSSARAPMEQLESQLRRRPFSLDARSSTGSTRSSRPATSFNYADAGYDNPALEPQARRR